MKYKRLKQKIILLVLFGIFLTLNILYIQSQKSEPPVTKKEKTDTLSQIKEKGVIRLITGNNMVIYNMHYDRPMGLEYDMAMELARHLNVKLEILNVNWDTMVDALEQGQGDFIASGITPTDLKGGTILFSKPFITVQQRVIHHKLILNPETIEELEGRTFHVRKDTAYQVSLEEIQRSGVDIGIILYDNITTEELIRKIHNRKIKYTVADVNFALRNQRYYPDIRIGIPIKDKEKLVWAVNKKDKRLLEVINQFLETASETGLTASIYQEYYGITDEFDYFDLKKFHERIETRLPQYKKTIIEESEKYGFDWRMIAAVIYQESHYNPWAESHTGVRGLMQVTEDTAREMGIENRVDPEQSIAAGIRYLYKLYHRFKDIGDPEERVFFTLASYNIGYGHVRDAQKIARSMGLNFNKWRSIRKVLPLLSKKEYYKETKYGFARGTEPVRYVKKIRTYYDILKQKTASLEPSPADTLLMMIN